MRTTRPTGADAPDTRIRTVNTFPDVLGSRPDDHARPAQAADLSVVAETVAPAAAVSIRWTLAVYLATRLGCLLLAIVETFFRKWSMWGMLSNWDGIWYLRVLTEGYPSNISHAQTPLGFLPLYPLVVWPFAHIWSLHPSHAVYEITALIVSLVAGASATVLVQKLAASWWGPAPSRRAVLMFCLFPGSIVFSMVYTEGLLLTLVCGSLLAMQQRRWLLAGILAGLSTAVGPVAVAIIPACAVGALLEMRRQGWRGRAAYKTLVAPALAPLGAVAFAGYLWIHDGTPFASYEAQRYGWQETSSPLALLDTAKRLISEISSTPNLAHMTVNTNYVAGLIGAVILLIALVLLVRPPRIPAPSLFWTLGVTALTFTSEMTPPNARMLLIAFPAVIVFAQRLRGRWFIALIVFNGLLLATMSWVSLVGVDLRP